MRKTIFMLIVLMAYPTRAQVSSGTSIILNFTKDKLIVAADSRGIHDTGEPPDNAYCKISAFSHQFIFVTVGSASYAKTSATDLLDSWNNGELAKSAIHSVPKKEDVGSYLDDLATYWAKDVGQRWDSLCKLNRTKCIKLAERSNGFLTAGIFMESKSFLLRGATISFNSSNFLSPIEYSVGAAMSNCWPCAEKTGKQICAGGSHIDVAADFCSKRQMRSKVHTRTPLKGYDIDTRLPVQIVERTIDAYEKSAGDVGGPIDVLSVTNDGSIHWIKRKENCPENQD